MPTYKTIKEVGSFDKGKEQIHTRVVKINDQVFLDARAFYRSDESWLPTRRGVAVPVEQAEEFRQAIEDLCNAAIDLHNGES